MPLLTDEQLHTIRQIIADHHAAFVANYISPEVLPPEVLQRLQEQGLISIAGNSIEDAYVYGMVLAAAQDPSVATMSLDQFQNYMRRSPMPLSAVERRAMQYAQHQAGQYAVGLGATFDRIAGQVIITQANQLEQEKIRGQIRDLTTEAIAKRKAMRKLSSDLKWATKDMTRDWDRIATTELHTAHQHGIADDLAGRYGPEVMVAKRPTPDACEHCKRLHLVGGNGPPRVFKLSELQANGTNFKKKARDWQAVVGSVHPNCQCQMIRVPAGWGFDENWDLVPGGDREDYASMAEIERAVQLEDELRKSFRLQGHIDFQGIPIAIENRKGTVRTWKTPEGDVGKTRMEYAYGYAKRTSGDDEDEIDVYVGPDPRSQRVFVVNQLDPATGRHDETKCFLGFRSESDAKLAYLSHVTQPSMFGGILAMDIDAFKRWLGTTEPAPGHDLGETKLVVPLQKALIKARRATPIGGKTPGGRTVKLVGGKRVYVEEDAPKQQSGGHAEAFLEAATLAERTARLAQWAMADFEDYVAKQRLARGTVGKMRRLPDAQWKATIEIAKDPKHPEHDEVRQFVEESHGKLMDLLRPSKELQRKRAEEAKREREEARYEAQGVELDGPTKLSKLRGKKVWLYHGTTTKVLDDIKKNGMRPAREHGVQSNVGSTAATSASPDFVFLTSETTGPGSAQWYAQAAAAKHGGEPVIVRVLVDGDDLERDPDDADIRSGSTQYVTDSVAPHQIMEVDGERLQKALIKSGPFIGPRGGLWADPQHTIPWKARSGVLKLDRKEVDATITELLGKFEQRGDTVVPKKVSAELEAGHTYTRVYVRTYSTEEGRYTNPIHGHYDPKQQEIVIRIPEGMAFSRDKMRELLTPIMLHEATHAVDRMKWKGGPIDDSDKASYYNEPREFRAFMQEAHEELTDPRAVKLFAQLKDKGGPVFIGKAISPTLRKVLPHLSKENRRRALRIVANAIQNLGLQKAITPEALEKAEARGGKYIRREPYVDSKGKRKFRYYYTESAAAREATAGAEVRLGKRTVTVKAVAADGTITLEDGGKTVTVTPDKWHAMLTRHYGRKYMASAERRATQVINAVLRHVPREQLEDLKGTTDAERLAELQRKVPEVYAKLEASFKRAGMSPLQAKRDLEMVLERRGWNPEGRALAIGGVMRHRDVGMRDLINASESLAAAHGSKVDGGVVAAVLDLRAPGGKLEAFPAKVAETGRQAEAELAALSKALAQAKEDQRRTAEALAQALGSDAIQKLQLLAQAFPGLQDKAIDEVQKTMAQVAEKAPAGKPKTEGAPTVVFVSGAGGRPEPLQAKYRLVEADSLIASHDPSSFSKRGDYPSDVQERAYHRDKAEQAKVIRNAQTMDPRFVVNTNPDAVNGPPMVTADGVVLGGNSRTMSMQRAYQLHPDKAAELKQYLSDHAHEVGLQPGDVAAMKNPVLIREVEVEDTSKKNLQLLVRQMNESFTQAMDPRTMQVAMGRRLTDQTLEALGNEMAEDDTLASFLASKRSAGFVNALFTAGVIDNRNVSQYTKKGTRELNEDGRQLVARILVGRTVGDADILSNTGAQMLDSVARSVPFMAQAKALGGDDFDLGDDLAVALDAFNDLQSKVQAGTLRNLDPKMSDNEVQKLVDNQFRTLFGDRHPVLDNPKAQTLLNVLIKKRGPVQMSKVFREFAAIAKKNPAGQATMFGGGTSGLEALRQAVAGGAEERLAASLTIPATLQKAGPFVGPRGGKWADAAHTIPWREDIPHEQIKEDAHAAVRDTVVEAAHRAVAAGADPKSLQYLGAGAEGILFEADGKAYKVARRSKFKKGPQLQNEAEALRSLEGTPAAKLVPKVHSYSAEHDVIVRDMVEGRPGGWAAGKKAREAYDVIVAELAKKDWGHPEFKEDSFIFDADGKNPKMVDIGFVSPRGKREAKWVADTIMGAKEKADLDMLDVGFALRASLSEGHTSPETAKKLRAKIAEVHGTEGTDIKGHLRELDRAIEEAEAGKSLQKAGPFIGPRGGKWADPKHTIPWKEPKASERQLQLPLAPPKREPVPKPTAKPKPKPATQASKPLTQKEKDAKLKDGLEIEGYAVAGTPAAFDLFGPHESMQCVRCGSNIQHCFATSKGAMGGDCLATLTGDSSTRALARKVNQKVDQQQAWWKDDHKKVTKYEIEESTHGGKKTYWLRMHYLDHEKMRINEYTGEVISGTGARPIVNFKESQLPMVASMIEQRAEGEGVPFEMPVEKAIRSNDRIATEVGAQTSPAGDRAPGMGTFPNFIPGSPERTPVPRNPMLHHDPNGVTVGEIDTRRLFRDVNDSYGYNEPAPVEPRTVERPDMLLYIGLEGPMTHPGRDAAQVVTSESSQQWHPQEERGIVELNRTHMDSEVYDHTLGLDDPKKARQRTALEIDAKYAETLHERTGEDREREQAERKRLEDNEKKGRMRPKNKVG